MRKHLPYLGRKDLSGQAFVEFALLSIFFFFMVFATFEAARYTSLKLRIASTTREAARLFVADEIEPATYATNSSQYAANSTSLYTTISNNVYEPIKDMVSPADLQNKGKVIISILRRYDGPVGDPPYSSNTTNTNDDRILVEYRFSYPTASTYTNWTTQVASLSNGYTNVFTNILPVSSLSIDERTVAVEIYHKTDFIGPQGFLKWSGFEYVYDMAVF